MWTVWGVVAVVASIMMAVCGFAGISMGAVLTLCALLFALGWLGFLISVPWGLYFTARYARQDGEESLANGIQVEQKRLEQLRSFEKKLLFGAMAAHILTAAAVYALAHICPGLIHKDFALVFLGSVILRPAWEYHLYLVKVLSNLTQDMRYPREDVMKVVADVNRAVSDIKNLQSDLSDLKKNLSDSYSKLSDRNQELATNLEAMGKRFEDVTAKISTDKDIVAGVQAFVKMLKAK